MIDLRLTPRGESLSVLCLGAHCDDIEIGCGGTVLKLIESFPLARFTWVVLSSDAVRKKEAMESAAVFLAGADQPAIAIESFRDGFFPYIGAEIKGYVESLKTKSDPDIIFTHFRSDLHQDHRLVAELTWNTFRDHLILEYEVPKYDGDLGAPNAFVHLSSRHVQRKIAEILSQFKSQVPNRWFTEDTFRSLMRLRGVESNAPSGYAEAFYARKQILA